MDIRIPDCLLKTCNGCGGKFQANKPAALILFFYPFPNDGAPKMEEGSTVYCLDCYNLWTRKDEPCPEKT
jgi:hypothetical protein